MAAKHTLRIVSAILTSVLIIALALVLVLVQPPQLFVDSASGTARAAHDVSQNRLTSFCPPAMALPDDQEYGDSEYRASTGDMTSSARWAAFGSVFASRVKPLDEQPDDVPVELGDGVVPTGGDSLVGLGQDASQPTVQTTDLLQSGTGTGQAGSIVSKATQGDLKGMSASSCVPTSLTQSFLLTGTMTGTSQQLLVANPSSKATSVTISLRGTEGDGQVSSSIGSTLTVRAHGLGLFDLAAAASGQEGLWVSVTSEQTPIASVVRTVVMDGLTPKGADYAMPLGQPAGTQVMPGVRQGDQVRVLVHSLESGEATVSWLTSDGLADGQRVDLEADRVTALDLGEAPKDALGVVVTGDEQLSASVAASREGEKGQQDFALTAATNPALASAMALPADGIETSLTLANTTNRKTSVTLTFVDGTGARIGRRDVSLPANGATVIDPSAVAADDTADASADAEESERQQTVSVAAVTLEDEDQAVVWSARFDAAPLRDAKVAAMATLTPTPLTPVSSRIWSTQSQNLVH